MNEEAMARVGPQRQKINIGTIQLLNMHFLPDLMFLIIFSAKILSSTPQKTPESSDA